MKGSLTYALAALAVIGAGAGCLLRFIDALTATIIAWAGLSLFGLRRSLPAKANERKNPIRALSLYRSRIHTSKPLFRRQSVS
jgi:hypothetical protein